MRLRRWGSELGIGARLALGSGASTRLRGALTAAGVAFGVAVLLLAASVPTIITARDARGAARSPRSGPGPARLRLLETDTTFAGASVTGYTLQPVRADPPVPPGLSSLPGPGEMVVSPALAGLLSGPGGAELRRRLAARVVGTIRPAGLIAPDEALFYRGSDALAARGVIAVVSGFGVPVGPGASSPVDTLLIIVMAVALLLPVGVFIAVAGRFAAEDRDRRLAALRLVGADRAATARIAAGEALPAAIIGLCGGVLLFVAVRPLLQHVTVDGVSVFASDIRPAAWLAALVAILVPLCAVAATLAGMRAVSVEPLGVSRRGRPVRRRLWWRTVPTALGFVLLLSLIDRVQVLQSTTGAVEAGAGVFLALIGLTAVLPWAVQALADRAPDGPVPWLLAARRLRADAGTTGRVVGAIGLAVAGAIALQMLFGAAETGERSVAAGAVELSGGGAPGSLLVSAWIPGHDGGVGAVARLRAVAGVRTVFAATQVAPDSPNAVTVASCAVLSRLAVLSGCRDGDSFIVAAQPGRQLRAGTVVGAGPGVRIRIPSTARAAAETLDSSELPVDRLLFTPAVAAAQRLTTTALTAVVALRPDDARAADRLRDAAARLDPLATVTPLSDDAVNHTLADLRHALSAGAVAVLALIGASLLVAAGEQLRERRRVLSVLAAAGTRRSTMAWSVLWQTALPVACGVLLAVVLGIALGAVLTRIASLPVAVDWSGVAVIAAAGALVVGIVTLLTMPVLWRLMSPDALRVE